MKASRRNFLGCLSAILFGAKLPQPKADPLWNACLPAVNTITPSLGTTGSLTAIEMNYMKTVFDARQKIITTYRLHPDVVLILNQGFNESCQSEESSTARDTLLGY